MIMTVKNIRAALGVKPCVIDKRPGCYRWWFKEEAAHQLLDQLPNIEWERIQKRVIDAEVYYALYFGIAKDMRQRLKWHICQHHTPSAVKSGTLSTLRKTLSALLGIDMTLSEAAVNKFIDENCMVEWEYTATKKEAEKIEKAELTKNYYPLNIQENPNLDKETKAALKDLRKKYRK